MGRRELVLRWLIVITALYLLICAVSIISRGFRALGVEQAESLFGFAANPLVGLAVGILATVLIQSSTTTTAITVAAVGSGALSVGDAVPLIMGSNLGTTVTCTFVALGFVGDRAQFRRALSASTIHDFFNLIAVTILFPIEVLFHPIERLSAALTSALYGSSLPTPSENSIVRIATRPVVNAATELSTWIASGGAAATLMILIGVALIFLSVRQLGRHLKALMVGRARAVLLSAVGGSPALAMASGAGVTVVTQSSTVTNSVLVPFAGVGTITPKQVYPVTLGANLGTTLTALLAAFAVNGPLARYGLQAAFVHVLFNVVAILIIFVIPLLRPLPLWLATRLAELASERRWVLGLYLGVVFVVLPVVVVGLGVVGVLA